MILYCVLASNLICAALFHYNILLLMVLFFLILNLPLDITFWSEIYHFENGTNRSRKTVFYVKKKKPGAW